MSKPTPGPWRYEYGAVYADSRDEKEPGMVVTVRLVLADREDNNTGPTERDANLRLTAAAPEMRDALNYLLRAYIEATTAHPDDAIRGALIDGVREVMNKADGR